MNYCGYLNLQLSNPQPFAPFALFAVNSPFVGGRPALSLSKGR
jgi:hypothetical protein